MSRAYRLALMAACILALAPSAQSQTLTPPGGSGGGCITNCTVTSLATGAASSSGATAGPLSQGTLTFSDTGLAASYQASMAGYLQTVVQNTSAATNASADVVVANNLATATTYYGNMGINSSTYTGSGAFNLANATYLTASNGDLALGTLTANGIHFVVNNGTTDAGAFSSTGAFSTTSAALGGATIGTNALAVTGTTALGGALTVSSGGAAITGNVGVTSGNISTNFALVAYTGVFPGTSAFGRMTSAADGAFSFSDHAGTNTATFSVPAAATLQLGGIDAAAPVAQILDAQSVVAGTTNTAGANLTIAGSKGTGTGAGGNIIFQVAPAGTTGSTSNALSTALTIAGNRAITTASNFTSGAAIAAASASAIGWTSRALMSSPADGLLKCTNNAATAACSIVGTATNDNAAFGAIGEYICAQVTNGGTPTGCATNTNTLTALTTATATNITSISLTAGDWLVCGNVLIIDAGTTVSADVSGWVGTASAAQPTDPNGGSDYYMPASSTGLAYKFPTGCMRQSLASTTTVYLEARHTFSVSTSSAGGFIYATRTR